MHRKPIHLPKGLAWTWPCLRLIRWLVRHELALLLILCSAGAGLWVFIELADEVVEGDTHALDERILLAMRTPGDPSDPLGAKWVEELARDFTALGGTGIQVVITLAMGGALLLQRQRRAAILVVGAVAGGVIISLLLKEGFDRPRPDLVPHGSYTYTSSFPSGHSMTSAVTYLTLGALLAHLLPGRGMRIYFISLAGLLTMCVGLSRVYLGVHWPTDVVAGWTAGCVWALLCSILMRWLQRADRIEEPGETTEELLESQENPDALPPV